MLSTIWLFSLVGPALASWGGPSQAEPTSSSDTDLLNCGFARYKSSEYTCYDGDKLCPVLWGFPTLPCSDACYLITMYTCNNGVLGPVSQSGFAPSSTYAPLPMATGGGFGAPWSNFSGSGAPFPGAGRGGGWAPAVWGTSAGGAPEAAPTGAAGGYPPNYAPLATGAGGYGAQPTGTAGGYASPSGAYGYGSPAWATASSYEGPPAAASTDVVGTAPTPTATAGAVGSAPYPISNTTLPAASGTRVVASGPSASAAASAGTSQSSAPFLSAASRPVTASRGLYTIPVIVAMGLMASLLT